MKKLLNLFKGYFRFFFKDRLKRIRLINLNFNNRQIQNTVFTWDLSSSSAQVRIFMICACFILCFILLAYKLVIIALEGYDNTKNAFVKFESRKDIVDRNNNLLAVNLPSSSLFANPSKIVDLDNSLKKLFSIVPNLSTDKLKQELQSDKNFVWVKRDLTPKEQMQIFDLGLPGFDFVKEQKRVYIFNNLLSHVLGYVGRDLVGLAGVEKSYDDFLLNKIPENKDERQLTLSIDVRLQGILDEEIRKTMETFKAKGAVGIIANPNNGEILAMVSKPDFNPHYPQRAKAEELFNMASLGIYEIGSVFKALTLAVGFDTNTITIHDLYDLSHMRVGKFAVKDYHPMRGWHSVPEIFLHSSNIGVSQIILEIGKNKFKEYLTKLGLLDQLKIELPERGTPLFPPDSRFNDLSLVTMSFGYAMAISPLHFIQAMIPVVNGGTLYPITLIKDKNKHLVGKKVFSEHTSEEMRKLFRLVVTKGTGRKAGVNGYLVGGKTGTANKLNGKKYASNNKRISSFFAIFPSIKPEYIVYIIFDEPKGTKESGGFATGGWTAAPAVGRVIERMGVLYGLQPCDEQDDMIKQLLEVEYEVNDAV